MTPTDEQLDIINAASHSRHNIMINAHAGCGKTSTLQMIESAQPDRPVLYLAFNKKNADDARKRLASTTTVKTFNSLGHGIWAKEAGKTIKLNPRKTGDLFRGYVATLSRSESGDLWQEYWTICQGVDLARTVGYIPDGHLYHRRALVTWQQLSALLEEEPSDRAMRAIDDILYLSIKAAYDGLIDFTDQIYMPALFGGVYPQFPVTLVDEYQDLNPLNHVMIKKLVGDRRLIGVGDPCQNIYGFRGAAAAGMVSAVEAFQMETFPLSVSFRCPERIVMKAQWRVPNFKWINPGGLVLVRARQSLTDFEDGSAIICRNNAPLFRLAMRLLHKGVSVNVSGSEVGPRVLTIMKKFGGEDTPRPMVLSAIDDWLAEKEDKGSKTAPDIAACMRVFAEYGDNLGSALTYADHLLKQSGRITLITGHKAKGLEWPTVYHLDPFLCKEDDQDRNLRYVIQTRSMDKYIEITSENIA